VIDGVIASFQREADPARLSRVAPQLTEFLGRDGLNPTESEVIRGLTAQDAVLPDFPWKWTAWYPKVHAVDNRLVAGWAEAERSSDIDVPLLAGSLFAVLLR
jgi:hypothetical protein